MSQLRAFSNSLPPDPNQGADPDAGGDPNAGQPAAGSITADQAYQMGFADGLAGAQTQRAQVEQSAPGPTVVLARYDDGYRDGQAKAADDLTNQGPAIGPAPPPDKPEDEDEEHPIVEKAAEEGLLHAGEHLLEEAGVKVAEGVGSLVALVAEIATGPGDTAIPEVPQWFSQCQDSSHGFFNSEENCGPYRNSIEEAQKDADDHNQKNPGHNATAVKKGVS